MPRPPTGLDADTIIVESQGGIGNQLFIYAFARELQLHTEVPVALDTWRHHLPNARPFQIGELVGNHLPVVNTSTTVPDRLAPQWNQWRSWLQKASTHFQPKGRTIFEKELSFNSRYLCVQPGSRLVGYFQSWKYFKRSAGSIRNEILSKRNERLDLTARWATSDYTAVHIRLGDYLQRGRRGQHGCLTPSYYELALRKLRLGNGERSLVLFSDDPEAAQLLLREASSDMEIKIHHQVGSDLAELLNLSMFSRIVCANSTFSWWAAWLSGLPGHQIVAPSNWGSAHSQHLGDLLPHHWQVI